MCNAHSTCILGFWYKVMKGLKNVWGFGPLNLCPDELDEVTHDRQQCKR